MCDRVEHPTPTVWEYRKGARLVLSLFDLERKYRWLLAKPDGRISPRLTDEEAQAAKVLLQTALAQEDADD